MIGPLIDMKAVERGDGAKGLLLGDDHVGRYIGQHGRLEEAAALGGALAAGHHLGAHFDRVGDVRFDLLDRFKSEEDAVKMANDTEFGLASYFYSRDIGRIWRVAEALEYGIVGINEGIISTEIAPFGDIKESGIGREVSKYGIEEFLEVKYLCMGGIDR